jgi:predicted metal-dependent hydrolase
MAQSTTLQVGPVTRVVGLGGRSIEYRLRRSTRSRGMRVTIDPRHGLVVSVPPATRRGWAHPEGRIDAFLRERQAWVLRHLARLARERDGARARGGPLEGGQVLYRGSLHRIHVRRAALTGRRSVVERIGGDDEDELVVSLGTGERRPVERILGAWLRERAAEAIDAAIAAHAPSLGVRATKVDVWDPSTRWGSASRTGRLMFSWRLVLAPPGSLETVVVHELAHLRVFGHGPGFWALVASRRPSHLADRAWLRRNSHALHSALEPVGEAAAGGGMA